MEVFGDVGRSAPVGEQLEGELHHRRDAHADRGQRPHDPRTSDQADERAAEPVVRAPQLVQAAFVLRQVVRTRPVHRQQRHLGPHDARLDGLGDALAVERVHDAGGVAARDHSRTPRRPDPETHRQAPALQLAGGAKRGDVRQVPVARQRPHERFHEVGRVHVAPPVVRGQDPDADVDARAAHREDPAVAGKQCLLVA